MALCIGDSDGPRTYVYHTLTPLASPRLNNPSNPPSRSSISSQSGSCTRLKPLSTPPIATPPITTPSPITTPTSPLSTPNLSEDAIVEMILKERDGCQRIQIPGVDEALYDQVRTRTDAISERLRYYYDLTSCTIIIDTLPSDIHESLQEYLVDTLKYSLRQWLVRLIPGAKVKVSGAVDRNLVNAGGVIKGKTPDQGFEIRIPGFGLREFPNIVFKIGYSESRNHLLDDARRWLTESRGEPVLCVIIFIFRKPSLASDFSDRSKWKTFLEVYERYSHPFMTILALSHILHQEILSIVHP
jgi:hypothetical protein